MFRVVLEINKKALKVQILNEVALIHFLIKFWFEISEIPKTQRSGSRRRIYELNSKVERAD